tara:strand:+ start:917 stop:1693 length:777 start_codon:yes stop_codon:yes gene_type:complete
MNRIILTLFLFFVSGYSQGDEIVILSPRVGTIIDIHENRFYRIFPKIRQFISAQIYSTSDLHYKVRIVVNRKGKKKTYEKKMSLKQFTRFQNKVNAQPEFTEQEREIMYAGMDFLRAAQIITDLPKPQYVKMIHSGNKRLRGTLVSFDNNIVSVQTGRSQEQIDLDNIELISYRLSDNEFLGLKAYIYAFSGAIGLRIAGLYNSQRSPRLDESWYYRFYGITMGLLFSGELYDVLSTILTPTETFILSQDKYEKNKRL